MRLKKSSGIGGRLMRRSATLCDSTCAKDSTAFITVSSFLSESQNNNFVEAANGLFKKA
jgi:hypothetical protein